MSAAAAVATLLVDVRPVDHPTARARGIGRYTAGLLGGLSRIGAPVIGLYATEVEAQRAREVAPDLTLRPWGPGVIGEHTAPGTWYLATQLMLHPVSLDPIPAVVTAARLPVAAVMYDVIPYRLAEHYQRDPAARALAQVRAPLARTVDAMLAISTFSLETAADELRFPIDRMRSIGAGVDAHFVPASVRAAPWPERVLSRDARPYVLAVTGADVRKNTEGLLRAWADVARAVGPAGARLVIATAAPEPTLARWRTVATELGIADSVDITGAVTDDEMVALLQVARLAILPSLEEGFGLPVLEAAACGCPAICSDTSSLPEVLDEPAAWFDPTDPASIAAAVLRGLADDDHRALLAAAGRRAVERFTWERVATDVIGSLAALGPRWPQRSRRPERRLAIAGAVDGAVVAALRRAAGAPRIDEFVDHGDRPDPTEAGFDRGPVRAVGRYAKRWDFDDIVVGIGPSPSWRASRDLATAVPCHVWLRHGATADEVPEGVRSVIVEDGDVAATLRHQRPDGPPIMVVAPVDGVADPPESSAVDELAGALVAWIADVDHIPAGTMRRFPAGST